MCVCGKVLEVQATGMSERRPQFTVSGAALSNSSLALTASALYIRPTTASRFQPL